MSFWQEMMSIKPIRWMVLILLSPVLLPFWLIFNHEEKVAKFFYGAHSIASDIRMLWKFIVVIIHSIGWLTTIIILSASIYALGCSVLIEFEVISNQPEVYSKLAKLFENNFAWAAATSIVGGTVAIGHVWNLELNREKFYEEKLERYRNKNK